MTLPWPPIDAEVSAAVARQLHTDISLYGRSGIIARFEDAFASPPQQHRKALARTAHVLGDSGSALGLLRLGPGPG